MGHSCVGCLEAPQSEMVLVAPYPERTASLSHGEGVTVSGFGQTIAHFVLYLPHLPNSVGTSCLCGMSTLEGPMITCGSTAQ